MLMLVMACDVHKLIVYVINNMVYIQKNLWIKLLELITCKMGDESTEE